MYIANSGRTNFGSKMLFGGEAAVSSATTSVTISGLSGDDVGCYGISLYWINPSLFSATLSLRPNGASVPSGSSMVRDGYTLNLGIMTSEPLVESDFVVGTLGLGVANSWLQGDVFLETDRSTPIGLLCTGSSFAEDGLLLAADRLRHHRRTGFWKDTSANITSITLQASLANSIAAGSDFRVFYP